MKLKQNLYNAILKHYQSQKETALYQLNLAFENPVAVGEHPKIVDDCILLLKQLAEAEEALETLEKNFGPKSEGAVE